MIKRLGSSIVFAVAIATAMPASAQLAVIDQGTLIQTLNTARNTLQQVQVATQQLQQAQQLYQSLNHLTNVSQLSQALNSPLVQRGLPPSIANSTKLLTSDLNQLGELGARAKAIYAAKDFSTGLSGGQGVIDTSLQLAGQRAALDQAVGENALSVTDQRSQGLAALANGLSSAADAKAVQDIAARATIEGASAANQTNQLLALQMQRAGDRASRRAAFSAETARRENTAAAGNPNDWTPQ